VKNLDPEIGHFVSRTLVFANMYSNVNPAEAEGEGEGVGVITRRYELNTTPPVSHERVSKSYLCRVLKA